MYLFKKAYPFACSLSILPLQASMPKDSSQLEKLAQTQADSELIDRCIQGDQAAWKEFVNRYHRLVYSVAHTLCPPGEDVSDVFQQVWLEVHQHLNQLRNVEALPAWLMTITKRRMYALIRARRNSEQLSEETPDLSEKLQQIEHEHTLERALTQLPDRCRKLIGLLYFDTSEPSYSEIAKVMSMPEASIGPTRARCLEKLRKLID